MPIERKQIGLRLTPELAERVKASAEAEGRTVNNWIEQTLLRSLFPPGWSDASPDALAATASRYDREGEAVLDAPVQADDKVLHRQAEYSQGGEVDTTPAPPAKPEPRFRPDHPLRDYGKPKPVELMDALDTAVTRAKTERAIARTPEGVAANEAKLRKPPRKRDVDPIPKKGGK